MRLKGVIFTVIFLILIGFGIYLFVYLQKPQAPADARVLNGAWQAVEAQLFETVLAQESPMWWGEEGKNFILNHSAPSFVTRIYLTGEELALYVTPQTNRIFEYPELSRVYGILDRYFKEEGFSFVSYNSLSAKVGLEWSDYVSSYERGALKCSVTTHNEVANYEQEQDITRRRAIEIIISCEDNLSEVGEEQIRFITELGLEGEEVGIAPTTRVGKILDLALYYRNSPDAYQIIAQENGTLTTLYNSQADGPAPSCAKMQGVPRNFYLNCR